MGDDDSWVLNLDPRDQLRSRKDLEARRSRRLATRAACDAADPLLVRARQLLVRARPLLVHADAASTLGKSVHQGRMIGRFVLIRVRI